MSLQVQLQKALSRFNFLESTVYDRYDLTKMIRPEDKFVIRQGDLIITNYDISDRRKRGLRYAHVQVKNDVWVFGGNHFILSVNNETVLIHPEHGITVIPENREKLNFYTFNTASD